MSARRGTGDDSLVGGIVRPRRGGGQNAKANSNHRPKIHIRHVPYTMDYFRSVTNR